MRTGRRRWPVSPNPSPDTLRGKNSRPGKNGCRSIFRSFSGTGLFSRAKHFFSTANPSPSRLADPTNDSVVWRKKTAFFSYKRKTVLLFGRLIHNHLIVKQMSLCCLKNFFQTTVGFVRFAGIVYFNILIDNKLYVSACKKFYPDFGPRPIMRPLFCFLPATSICGGIQK